MISASKLVVTIDSILKEELKRVHNGLDEAKKEASQKILEEVKATSPRGHRKGKNYASTWAIKDTGHSYIIHNKDNYRLTHLLERGHAIVAKGGRVVGRASARPHLEQAEQNGIKHFEESVRRRLENG